MVERVQVTSKRLFILVTTTSLLRFPFSLAGLDDCDTSNALTFNCSGAGLTAAPSHDNVPYQCQNLDLSNNLITNISRLNFSSTNIIQTLILANNRINKIQPYAFEQMQNVVILDLSGNKLDGHGINEHHFRGLGKLRNLSMEGNPLRFIGKDTFNFMQLPFLKHLVLSHCVIGEIEEEGIMLPDLEFLDLSWNSLKVFQKESLKMMNDLRILDLSRNQIQILNEMPHLPEIRVLNFDYNHINNVSVRDAISFLADSLEELYIRNNDIMRFTEDSFPLDLDTFEGIHLENNPIHCDCRMKWVVKEGDLKDKNFTIPCEFPAKHKGQNLLNIPPEELKCGTRLYKILILIGLSVVIVLCFTLVIYLLRRKKTKKSQKPKIKVVRGVDYTAVYTKDEDDVRVQISDGKRLLSDSGTEFDV